jgi:hypothetical protein
MDLLITRDARWWRNLRQAGHDVQDRRRVPWKRRLKGIKGMAWSAALVIGTGKTASWLSRLADGAQESVTSDRSPEYRCSRANSKIIYQYLRGERAPSTGSRGKWGFDLTSTVHALPGGALARLYLESPLWELLDSTVSRERARQILLLMGEHQAYVPLRAYICAWANYRISVSDRQSRAEQQKRAERIGSMHSHLRSTDAVFNYLSEPLLAYLRQCEPQIPLDPPAKPVHEKSRLAVALMRGFERFKRYDNRFYDGVDRYLLSGRLPDRRFMRVYRPRWDCVIRWLEAHKTDLQETANVPEPVQLHGWQNLYEGWGLPIAPITPPSNRRSIRFC